MGYDTIQEQYTLKWNDSIQFDSEGFRFDSIRFDSIRFDSIRSGTAQFKRV